MTPIGTEPESNNGRSNKIAAEAVQVGERTVARAIEVKRENPVWAIAKEEVESDFEQARRVR